MKPKEYRIRNLGPIKNLEGTFPDNGVVYAVADNGGGKTSLLRTFKDFLSAGSNEGKLSRGARSGEWEQTFTAANGDEYVAKFDLDPTTGERLTIITPEGKVVKKIGDIKEVFGYPDFSVENFIAWGHTAEGRKKQADVIFRMLPQETQDKYTTLGLDERQFFDDRTYKGRQLKEKEGALKTATPSDEDLQEAMLYQDYQNKEQEILEGMTGYDEIKQGMQEAANNLTEATITLTNKQDKLDDKRSSYRTLEEEVKELEEQLRKKKEQLAGVKKEGATLAEEVKSAEEKKAACAKRAQELDEEAKRFGDQEEKLKSIREQMGECIEIKNRVEAYESLEEEVEALRAEHANLTKNIDGIRKAKRQLIEESELPVKDLVIEDGELFVQKEDGLFKFSEEEMCTSELLVKGIEIALAANPKTKILFLFNANLLNTEKREALDKMAKHLDYLFLLELVDESVSNIQLVAHEDYS